MKHKKIITISIVVLAVVLIISALSNSTYALFSNDAYGANTNQYTTGMLLIEANSKSESISLANALPITDEEGLKTNPYVFTIKNIGNLDYLFDVKLLSTGDSSTSFLPQYIKLQIDDGDVTTLANLTNGEIKSDVTLLAGDSIDVSIRVWLSIDTPNSEIGKSFNSKIVTDGQAVYTSSNNEFSINAAQYIRSLYNGAEKTVVTNNGIEYNQAQSVSLMNDRLGGTTSDYNGGNIRYYGANPNNYIYFNCRDYSNQNDETCEKWRIIGVFDGKLKLIRNESIGDFAWDDDSINDWNTSTLKDTLNSGTYYSSLQTKNSKTIELIAHATWYTNGTRTSNIYANTSYIGERTGDSIWLGKIALAYPSDYGYSVDLNSCTNTLLNYEDASCASVNWLTSMFTADSVYWFLTPGSGSSSYVQHVYGGCVNCDDGTPDGANAVLPVLYLDPELVINKGAGTSDNPYQIYVDPPKRDNLIGYITNLYTSGNPTVITQETSNDSYYYSYQDDTNTWGLMNDGLKVDNTLDATTTGLATTVTDTTALTTGTEGNIRYFGPSDSVNNYIYFNCNDYSNQSLTDANGEKNCELWRIIGIVDGKVKIIKNDSIGNLAWDQDKNQDSTKTTYNNNWTTSSLQEFLNGLYYNRGTIESHPYYSDSTGTTTTTLNLKTIGITEATRNNNLILESTWYLGGYSTSSGLYPNDIYNYERQNKVGTTIYSTNDFIINKNIGLMYASDYGYGTDLTKCSIDIYKYNTVSACTTGNWLFNSSNQWLTTPHSSISDSAWRVFSSGSVSGRDVYITNFGVRPVLYLDSELGMESGHEGTSIDPYRISIS